MPDLLVTGLERGRRRTRQDQISLEVFRHSRRRTGEIANHLRSAPNEENLFLLPDRPLAGAGSPKMTIQPFDLMSRRHPLFVDKSRSSNPLHEEATVGRLV
jgi:hypothetical protein